jgi:hypothetical protein
VCTLIHGSCLPVSGLENPSIAKAEGRGNSKVVLWYLLE